MTTKARSERRSAVIEAYKKAMMYIHKRDFANAKSTLEKFLQDYADREDMVDRARQFVTICDNELSPRRVRRQTADDYHYSGVVKFNDGDFEGALAELAQACEMEPKDAKNLYMMASASCGLGDMQAACDYLKKAIKLEERFKVLAATSPDFDNLREEEDFIKLMAPQGKSSG